MVVRCYAELVGIVISYEKEKDFAVPFPESQKKLKL